MSKKSKFKHLNYQNANNPPPIPNKLFLIPLIFIIGILPFIMRLHIYHSGLSSFAWFSASDNQFDIFLYYKQVFFILTCIIMMIFIGYKIYYDKINHQRMNHNKVNHSNINHSNVNHSNVNHDNVTNDKRVFKLLPIFIPLIIYGILAFLSTIVSKYASFGFRGMFEQFESIFVLLGYCLIVYYAYLFIDSEEDVQFIFRLFLISILLMSILGILQATGHDIFATNLGKKSFLPTKYWGQLDKFNLVFGLKYVYLTLYNPNYAGVYVALIIPIIISLMITSSKLKSLLIYGIALIGLFITLIGSKSEAAIIGITVSFLFIIILFRKYIIKHYKILAAFIVLGIACVIVLSPDISRITNLVKLLKPTKVQYNLTDIKTNDDNVIITYKGNDLIVDYEGTLESGIAISPKDSSNKEIAYTINQENGSYTITDERFKGFIISPAVLNNMACINILIDGKNWVFTNQIGDNTYYYINSYGKPDKIKKADSALFTGYETFASTRGYIWSRSIPLLKNNIILGSGADTYAIEFPQQDYVSLSNAGFSNSMLTKPHNLYLQIGIQTGVLSLLAILVFYGMYFCSSIRLYINGRFDTIYSQIGVSIFIGTISYMIMGITNDSSITVAPIFWTLIGIGIACNYKVLKKT